MKRIFATRPADYNTLWQARLHEQGYDVTALSLLALEPLAENDTEAIKQRILALDTYAYAIFVSQNAVRYGLPWIDDYWPQLPQDIRWFGIGAKTAKVLEDAIVQQGGHVQSAPAMHSEGLLALPELQQVREQKVLIFRGVGGRTTLADTLRARGAQVDYCELYRRTVPKEGLQQLRCLTFSQDDIVPVFSGESLKNFAQLAADVTAQGWQDVRLIVPGERVRQQAVALGFKYIYCAENASEGAMFNAVCAVQES